MLDFIFLYNIHDKLQILEQQSPNQLAATAISLEILIITIHNHGSVKIFDNDKFQLVQSNIISCIQMHHSKSLVAD